MNPNNARNVHHWNEIRNWNTNILGLSKTWLWSPLFLLIASLFSDSFLSTKTIKSSKLGMCRVRLLQLRCLDVMVLVMRAVSTKLPTHSAKKTTKARKQAIPQIRKRPHKLLSERRLSSMGFVWAKHPFLDSHLSWILWSSPFSESWRIAVDRSLASMRL